MNTVPSKVFSWKFCEILLEHREVEQDAVVRKLAADLVTVHRLRRELEVVNQRLRPPYP